MVVQFIIVVAMYLEKYPTATPDQVAKALRVSAVAGVIKMPKGKKHTPNYLLSAKEFISA